MKSLILILLSAVMLVACATDVDSDEQGIIADAIGQSAESQICHGGDDPRGCDLPPPSVQSTVDDLSASTPLTAVAYADTCTPGMRYMGWGCIWGIVKLYFWDVRCNPFVGTAITITTTTTCMGEEPCNGHCPVEPIVPGESQ